MEQRSCDPTHLVAGVASALGVRRRSGAQLDGLGLMEDDGGQRLLPQRQHVQLGLQHGLEVLGGGMGGGGGRQKHRNQQRSAENSAFLQRVVVACFGKTGTGGGGRRNAACVRKRGVS